MSLDIHTFVGSLPLFDPDADHPTGNPEDYPIFNPWRDSLTVDADSTMPQVRCSLLRQHMACVSPRLIIVNECCSFYGSRQTGVPLTSEYLLLNNQVPRLHRDTRLTSTPNMFADPAAGLFWSLLAETGLADDTLCWDMLPFQPYRTPSLMNRPPTNEELLFGMTWLKELLTGFPGVPVLCIGARVRKLMRKHFGETPLYAAPHVARGTAANLHNLLSEIALETKTSTRTGTPPSPDVSMPTTA